MRSAERGRLRPSLPEALGRVEQRLKRAGVAFGHGTTDARDEAAWLVLHALKLPLDTFIPGFRRRLDSGELARIDALLDERIRSRKPMAYLAREAWLGEHRFYVDERVIVPRSYIAELLGDKLAPWLAAATRVRTALDLCTGSGCLAILVALAFRRAAVDAADISDDALDVARHNVGAYRLARRVRVLRSDVYGALAGRRYDLIVSNPPYVTAGAMRRLPAEYRQEPALALAGGHDGLELVRPILEEAPAYLAPGGMLVVEVGHNRERVEKAWPRVPFVWPETSGGDDCVFIVRREALEAGLPPASFPATRAGASPRRQATRRLGRASTAAAARSRRSARE